MKKIAFLIFVILPLLSFSQIINDDFEDGNIDDWYQSPAGHWGASTTSPINGSYSLHQTFDNDESATDKISIQMTGLDVTAGTTIWQFQVKYTYDPSSTNNWHVFLMADANADQMQPGGAVNGYAIGVNATGYDDTIYLYSVSNGSYTKILNTHLNWNDVTSDVAGFKIIRRSDGTWTVYVDKNGGFDFLLNYGSTTDNTFTNASYFGVCYEYTSSQDRKLWIDDVLVLPPSGTDENSSVAAGSGAEPAEIPSTVNEPNGIQVFDFDLTDQGSDGVPTIVQSLTITAGDNNNISDWQNVIAGAKLFGQDLPSGIQGVITSDKIIFSADTLFEIDNGTTENYKLYIWLKNDLSAISDNDNFEFRLDYRDILTAYDGSSFGSGEVESGDNNLAVSISAMELRFFDVPYSVLPGENFSLGVKATDANGNLDLDASGTVTLSLKTGSGNLSSASGLSKNLTNGIVQWNDLQYDVLGNFSILAQSTGLDSAVSQEIVCSEYLFFLDDDFEDGEILDWTQSLSAHWAASPDNPIDGVYSLRQVYDASDYGTDVITHSLPGFTWSLDSIVWRFQLRYENGSPSSTNNWWVFLAADNDYSQMSDDGNINAFVVGVNFGTTDDLVKLWYISGGSIYEVISTSYDWNNVDETAPKGFEILRDNSGQWTLKIDDDGGFDNLVAYGTGTQTATFYVQNFGIVYNYSSTQDQKLTVDDVYCGEPVPDNEPPVLDTVMVISANHLKLIFSEDISQATASDVNNYSVDGIGNPSSAVQNTLNKRIVDLYFATDFQEDVTYTLQVQNIQDIAGNTIDPVTYDFVWKNIYLVYVRLFSEHQIDLQFSKIVDETTAGDVNNYTVNNGMGNPSSATVDEEDSTWVHLYFDNAFVNEQSYTLHVENISDKYGNVISPTDYDFVFFVVSPYDVVINELMIDVNPAPVALPPYKYIELYNNTNFDIDLTGWVLKIGDNKDLTFPETQISAKGYVIICSEEAADELAPFGTVVPVLVESYLTATSGKRILLKNARGQIIEDLTYSPDWYNDEDHDDGGWSLERIDPTNFCNQENNWHASQNYAGGTPGMVNTVYGSNPDNEPPYLTGYEIITSQDLDLYFSETLDTATSEAILSYVLNSQITPFTAVEDENHIIHLHFLEPFLPGDNYLSITNLRDYCGNNMSDTVLHFFYQPISVIDAEPKSATQLKIYFTEPVGKAAAENPLNYVVNNGVGSPQVALRDANDSSVVHLFFGTNFPEDTTCTIEINSLTDIYGNPMETKYLDFTYHIPQPFDIVINEMMIDVNPEPQGLPPVQYIELLNTRNFDIWLTDWVFIAEDQNERIFPTVKIPAGSYLLMTTEDATDVMSQYGKVVGILGTNDLIQTGKELKIFDNRDNLIYHLRYSKDWYHDEIKEDGGWSLEKIDPMNFCESGYNWTASTDISGGTPGRRNSVYAQNKDTLKLKVLSFKTLASNRILIVFNKNVSFETALDTANYFVSNSIGYPFLVEMSDTSYKAVILYFKKQFDDEGSYTLTVENLSDDCGNPIESTSLNFTYYRIHPEYVWVLNEHQLQVKFSETVDYITGTTLDNYFIDNGIGNPNYIVRSSEDPSLVYLQFSENFKDGETYTLSVENVKDINGNVMHPAELEFVYYTAKVNDLAINEILFNPYPGGFDFVELYNRTPYPINLKDIRIAKRDENDSIVSVYRISENNLIFNPHSYLVLTVDTAYIRQTYPTNGGMFVQLKNMPAFPDDEGTVVILNDRDSVVDEFHYNEDMHFKLISDPEGVSLERVNYDRPTQDTSNWHSAAASVGYATPGVINSQFRNDSIVISGIITISPEVFSPDNDGFDDWTEIYYRFDKPGYFANVMIFDKTGHLVRYLVRDQLIGQEGFWTWDGLNDNNQKVKVGIYAVVVQIFDETGKKQLYKKPVVVAGMR